MNKKVLAIIFFISFSIFLMLFNSSFIYSAQAATTWTPPTLQIKIPTLEEFTTPTQCGTATDGQPIYCVKWIGEYIAAIYKYGIGVIGIVAAIAIMIGGIRWLTAGGNPSSVKDAQSWITGAVTGLILALTSFLILNLINPNLVNFQPLRVKVVKTVGYPTSSSSKYSNCKPETDTTCSSDRVSTGNMSDCSDVMGNYVGEGEDLTKYKTCCCQVSNTTGCGWQSDACNTTTQNEVTSSPVDSCGSTSTNYHCCCSKASATEKGCSWGDSTCGSNARKVSDSGNCSGTASGENTTCCCSWACTAATQGNCSPTTLASNGWNCGDVDTASAVCRGESGGNIGSKSGTDSCTNDDGKKYSYSLGLFQINVKYHQNSKNKKLNEAFPSSCNGLFSGSGSACRMKGTAEQYNTCVSDITNVSKNLQLACILKSSSGGFTDWSYYNDNCK
ncbi:MAG: hypothetical protein WC715_02395 [Patescibacteria group bacterium]